MNIIHQIIEVFVDIYHWMNYHNHPPPSLVKYAGQRDRYTTGHDQEKEEKRRGRMGTRIHMEELLVFNIFIGEEEKEEVRSGSLKNPFCSHPSISIL